MKTVTLSLCASLILFAGCSKKETASSGAADSAKGSAASASATSGPREVVVTGNDTMKFDVTRIEAKAGEELKIVLKNVGAAPKVAMGHNLIVLKPGTNTDAYAMAAMTSAATEYQPSALADQVVAATKLLGPKETDQVVLKGLAAGEYPYVCTFPGHYQSGMKGVLVVK